MKVRIVHKKSEKDYYMDDVVRVLIMPIGRHNPSFTYRLTRKYQRDGKTVTDIAGFCGDEYYVAEVYDEENWHD